MKENKSKYEIRDSSYILLGVHTPMFNIPHIHEGIIPFYHSRYTLLIIPQYKYYGKKFIGTLSFFNISLLRTEMQYIDK
jgi:hypothetical protein